MKLLRLCLLRSVHESELMEISDKWKLPWAGWQVQSTGFGIIKNPYCQKEDDDDIDHSLAHLAPKSASHQKGKGKLQLIERDDELEKMLREKDEADANRGQSSIMCS